jgi:hypothetical protein
MGIKKLLTGIDFEELARQNSRAGRAAAAVDRRAKFQGQYDAMKGQVSQVKPQMLQMEGPYKSQNSQELNIAPTGEAYKAKTVTGPLPEYNQMRNRVQSQANSANQAAQDAIKRRFAAMGGLNTGSFVKQAQLQEDSNQASTQEALQGVDAEEAKARRELEQIESQKEFQSQEALQGRKAAAYEAALGRQEAVKSRDFAAEQAVLQRNMQREFQNADQQFRADVFSFDSQSKLAQLEMQWEQLEQDRQTTEFNMEQAEAERADKGLFESLGL